MLIQTVPVPKGTERFEQERQRLIQELQDSIPSDFHLPESLTDNIAADVTGIPQSCGILTEEELKITEDYDATSLAQAIAKKKYTAVAVARAFAIRAAVAHQLTCCLTQFFMDEAIERAKYLDDYLEKNGKTIGPLHGVPVSVKEHMMLAGHYSSFGYFSTRTFNDNDSLMIKILRDAGAVFYVKTNQPQGIMHLESDGFMGRVNNPHNIHLSAGGSTGGESALVAMKGSVLGLGTDIGGSVRGPSAFCGIHGFKPTSYTLTLQDFLPSGFPAELNILCSTGPMTRTLRDADLYMRIMKSSSQHLTDPRIIPLPWKGLSTPLPNKPIKIGIMMNDGDIVPQPPILRAMKWAEEKLSQSSTFELRPFKPHNSAEAMKLLGEMYWPDSGHGTKCALAATGEPMHPPDKSRPLPQPEKTATEVSAQRVVRDAFRQAFVASWNEQDVDVVLAPCFVGPASKHDTAFYWNYTALWNFVDYPAAVFPTGLKVEEGETYEEGYMPLSDRCKHVKELWGEKGEGFEGAPIDLQLIGRRYHDSELFGALGEVQKVLGFA